MADRESSETIRIRLGEMRLSAPEPAAPQEPPAAPSKPPFIQRLLGRLAGRLRLSKISDLFAALRTVVLNGLLLVTLLAMVTIAAIELRRSAVVIDPIRPAGPLEKAGYSGDVLAQRLWDAVTQINNLTPSAKERVNLLAAAKQVDFQAPGAGISLRALVQMLRPFFGLEEKRIAGEFICTKPECTEADLALRLRVFTKQGMTLVDRPRLGAPTDEAGLNEYLHDAALDLLRELDPYIVAYYLFQTDKDPAKAAAEREALRLIRPSHPQRKWALNMLGLIAAERGDYDAAIDWYKRAAGADEPARFPVGDRSWTEALVDWYERASGADGFAIAYANWADALRAKGEPDKAIEMTQRAIGIDPNSARAYDVWAEALSDKGAEYLAAEIEKRARVAELEPESALAFSKWGDALFKNAKWAEAADRYRRATELEPMDAAAHFNWGLALEKSGDLDAAIARYTRATELDNEDVFAFTKLAGALIKKEDYGNAVASLERLTEIDPKNAVAFYDLGIVLWNFLPDRLADAAANLRQATELDPQFTDAHLDKGMVLEELRNYPEAIDAFEAYLRLAPDAKYADDVRAKIEELRKLAAGELPAAASGEAAKP